MKLEGIGIGSRIAISLALAFVLTSVTTLFGMLAVREIAHGVLAFDRIYSRVILPAADPRAGRAAAGQAPELQRLLQAMAWPPESHDVSHTESDSGGAGLRAGEIVDRDPERQRASSQDRVPRDGAAARAPDEAMGNERPPELRDALTLLLLQAYAAWRMQAALHDERHQREMRVQFEAQQ